MSIADDFESRIDDGIKECYKIGYIPRTFMQMRNRHGTISAIKRLIHSNKIPDGFLTLLNLKRMDLSVENIIQEDKWKDLFTEEDRSVAKDRLKGRGKV